MGTIPKRIVFTPMPNEARLEDIIAADLSIIDPHLLLVGRQVATDHGNFIDLLAMDAAGNLVVLELKRNRTPREVVAQLLDYGSWVHGLADDDIARIFATYQRKYRPDHDSVSLDDAYKEHFGLSELPEELNESHRLLIVAAELDLSTERIINYLHDVYGVAINAAFFRFFQDGDAEYLSRAWLIDPTLVVPSVLEPESLAWNGEYYVSFGVRPYRQWEDALKYGYISAGTGLWYTNTLQMLAPGDRIWVNVPGSGYVGVGTVTEEAVPITEFTVTDETGQMRPIHAVLNNAPDPSVPEEELEHYVRVEWSKAVPLAQAIREKGFFGNQNTVARPRTRKWAYTVERLMVHFDQR